MLGVQKEIWGGKKNIKEAKEMKGLTWVSTNEDMAKVSFEATAQ